jgi:hypothetical protein
MATSPIIKMMARTVIKVTTPATAEPRVIKKLPVPLVAVLNVFLDIRPTEPKIRLIPLNNCFIVSPSLGAAVAAL